MRWLVGGFFVVVCSAFTNPELSIEIGKNYPGFQMLEKADMVAESISSGSPAVVFGDFNHDGVGDFAAVIRSVERRKQFIEGRPPYEYYSGKFVTCFGQDKGFRCQVISNMTLTTPVEAKLGIVPAKSIKCLDQNGKDKVVKTVSDSISWNNPAKGGSIYIFQEDGSFLNCVTSS
jgi:hypothetical protein